MGPSLRCQRDQAKANGPEWADTRVLGNPQSWNRYAYVFNNPLALTDPLGLWCTGDGDWAFSNDPFANAGLGFSMEGPSDCLADSELSPGDTLTGVAWQSILPGENSTNWPMGSGNPISDLWQALGLPSLPCQSQFGPWCDPGMLPNPWIMDMTPNNVCYTDGSPCDKNDISQDCALKGTLAGTGFNTIPSALTEIWQGQVWEALTGPGAKGLLAKAVGKVSAATLLKWGSGIEEYYAVYEGGKKRHKNIW